MKLGEALARRGEIQTRLQMIGNRLQMGAIVQEGDSPPEDPDALLEELDRLVEELERLIASINLTNAEAEIEPGLTLTQALARRDTLDLKLRSLRGVADTAAALASRYSRSEIRMVRTFDLGTMRKQIDDLAKVRRELDVAIQEANWRVDLAEH